MIGKAELFSILLCGGVLFFIIFLIRTKRLRLKYSLLWIFTVLTMLFFSFFPRLLINISHLAGIVYAPSFLFLMAFLFLLVIVLHYSVVISILSETNKGLIQKLSLLNKRLENLEKKDER